MDHISKLCLCALALITVGLGVTTACAIASRGRIEGVVKNAAGAPVKGVAVGIDKTTATGAIQEILPVTNEDGRFAWPNLPPGTYTLRAVADGYRPQTRDVEVQDGATAKVEFTLQAATP